MTIRQNSFFYNLFSGFWAGVMIAVGGTVYLSCESKVAGAFLFAIGLLTVCTYGLKLFTGAIGYLLTDSQRPFSRRLGDAAAIWLGNLCGTLLVGFLAGWLKPTLAQKSSELAAAKLALSPVPALVLGIFCGMLMFLAVDIYRNRQGVHQLAGVFTAVPVFILAGFEHSVADMYYLAAGLGAGVFSIPALGFLLTVTLGNALGAWLLAGSVNILKSAKS